MKKTFLILSLAFGLANLSYGQAYSPDQVDLTPMWNGCSSPECTNGKIAEFIEATVQYPPYARENNIADNVFVKFIVEPTGRISNVHVGNSNGTMLDREALRVINSIPPMAPGVKAGQNVAVQYVVPVNFVLN